MKSIYHSFILLAIALVSGCTGMKVISETASNSDLRKYNFYTIADSEEGFLPNVNPAQKMQIEQAIVSETKNLSILSNNSGVAGPDILVSYFVVVDTKYDVEAYADYYGRRRWQYPVTSININEYKEGTLLVDFIDAKTRKVVWHGSTSGVVSANSVKMEEKINEAVKAIFKQYKADQSK